MVTGSNTTRRWLIGYRDKDSGLMITTIVSADNDALAKAEIEKNGHKVLNVYEMWSDAAQS